MKTLHLFTLLTSILVSCKQSTSKKEKPSIRLSVLLFIAFGLISCNNNQTANSQSAIKAEAAKLNDFLKKYEEPSQFFNLTADKPAKVKGKQGTIISINPGDLETEKGQAIGKSIKVELKELSNQKQLLRANAQTTSNGKLLVSGGAYFIHLTSEGQALKLKNGKSLSVEFPNITTKKMYLFYGQRDSLGQMNWLPADQRFEPKPAKQVASKTETYDEIGLILEHIADGNPKKPLTESERKNRQLEAKVYQAVQLQKFGWINCDAFPNEFNCANLQYTINTKDSIVSAGVYLVLKDMNSIVQSSYFSFTETQINTAFQGIPIGTRAKLIAFSIKNGKTYTYKSDLTIKPNTTVQIAFKETEPGEVDELFEL